MPVTDSVTKRFLVFGRVQGVFFRESTRKFAQPLGIDGSAVNLIDGSVEVIARGTVANLEKLERYLQQGPRWASVKEVKVTPFDGTVSAGFLTG